MTYLERRFLREQVKKFHNVRWRPKNVKERSIAEIALQLKTCDPSLGEWIGGQTGSLKHLTIAQGEHRFAKLKEFIGLDD